MGEVTLFVGAPFSGKTLYYEQSLKHCGYTRISAAEIYASDPHANLRIVVQKIVAFLKKNHNVVIDDENCERQTRLSFLNGITKKIPSTTYSCFQFVPSFGTAQLHICKEWVRGRQFAAALQSHVNSRVRRIDFRCVSSRIESHSTDTIDLNLDLDRFKFFKRLTSPLVCFCSHKLTSPILVMQWEGMVETARGDRLLRRGVCEAVCKWAAANNDGNIVVLFDQEGSGHIQDDEMLLLKTLLEKVPTCPPVHYVVTKDTTDFGRPPNSGVVVWIGYLFAASVHHKSSLYVHQSKHHQNCAEELSMRNITAKRLFSRPQTVNTVHYSEHEVHHILHKVVHINPKSPAACSSSQSASTPSRTLPLFSLAEQLEDSQGRCALHATWNSTDCRLECKLEEADASDQVKHISADDGNGRVLGMVYVSFECLKRSQEKWQGMLEVVMKTTVEYGSEDEKEREGGSHSKIDPLQKEATLLNTDLSISKLEVTSKSNSSVPIPSVNRSLPDWIRESSQDSSGSQSSSSQSKCEPKQRKTHYRMTESELLKTAMEYLKEADESSVREQEVELPSKIEEEVIDREPQVDFISRASDHELDVLTSNNTNNDFCTTSSGLATHTDKQFNSDSFLDELFM